MNWPPINVPILGRSGLIAVIALLHIPFFANFVMGAPVVAAISEWLGGKTGDKRYVRISKDLSVMALVAVGIGALGGVGLVATNIGLFPKFFSVGARIFFWPLALEIPAFLTEAIFIAIYRYTWNRMAHRPLHILFGFLGAFGAWLSGFIINGLASFMLTPGRWVETQRMIDAVFNPSMPPSYLHRVLAAFSITGFFMIAYALWRIARAKTAEEKDEAAWALRYSAKWAVIPTVLQIIPGLWYLYALEVGTKGIAPEGSVVPKIISGSLSLYWYGAIVVAVVAVILAFLFGIRNPSSAFQGGGRAALILSIVFILATTALMGFTRERARKPYLVYGVMYGNQVMAIGGGSSSSGEALLQSKGCLSCHSFKGQGAGTYPLDGIGSKLTADEIRKIIKDPTPGMVPFKGNEAELEAIVEYLASQK